MELFRPRRDRTYFGLRMQNHSVGSNGWRRAIVRVERARDDAWLVSTLTASMSHDRERRRTTVYFAPRNRERTIVASR
jgi:hypothetical protein